MISSTLIEQKAAALFLFSSNETGLFWVERALPHQGNVNKQTSTLLMVAWCQASLASAFQSRTIAFRWMKIVKVVFIQANRSFDLSSPIKLAKFRVFIHSKMEHKINKIRRNLYTSEKPGI